MKAIIAASKHWNTPYKVGCHFWAKHLAVQGFQVAFVSDPLSPVHMVKSDVDTNARRQSSFGRTKVFPVGAGSVLEVVPFCLFPPKIVKGPALRPLLDHWDRVCLSGPMGVLEKAGFMEPDILYIDSSLHTFWADRCNPKVKIFRVQDHLPSLHGAPAEIDYLARTCANTSTLTIYSSDALKEYVKGLFPQQMLYSPNGVDLKHFQQAQKRPQLYDEVAGPIIIYVGDMGKRFNFDWLKYAASQCTAATFVMIGDNDPVDAACMPRNVRFLGRVSYEDLPAYLQHATVGIIPFNRDKYRDLVDATNPLKAYQYLASGIPVVSSYWPAIGKLNSPVLLAETQEEFVTHLKTVYQDTLLDRDLLRQFAMSYDWGGIIDKAISFARGNL